VAIRQLFEHGSETVSCGLKVSCSFFRITMLKKAARSPQVKYQDKRGTLLEITSHF